MDYDVVIIGGGSAGLALAHKLEDDFKVGLFEQKKAIGTNCHKIINRECLKSYGFDEGVTTFAINIINFFSPSGCKLQIKSDRSRGYVINLETLEKELLRTLSKTKLFLDTKVTDIRPGKILAGNAVYGYKVLIGADGINSPVRRKTSCPVPRVVYCYGEVVGGLKNLLDYCGVIFSNEFAKGHYGWIEPINDTTAQFGFGAYLGAKNIKDIFNEFMRIHPAFVEYRKENVINTISGALPTSMVMRKTSDLFKSILIGDASGGEPFFGGSLHKNIDEVNMATDVVRAILTDGASISRYEDMFKQKFAKDFSNQEKIRQKFDQSNDNDIERLFKIKQTLSGSGLVTSLITDLFKGEHIKNES